MTAFRASRVGAIVTTAVISLVPAPALSEALVEAGETELGVNWFRESPSESGWEASVKMGLTDDLQLGLSGSTIRNTEDELLTKISGWGLDISWWPLKLSSRLTAGTTITLSDGEKSVSNGRDVAVGLKWAPAGPVQYQWDLGYDYKRNGDDRESSWGTTLSIDTDISDTTELELELSKAAGEKPAQITRS